MKTSKGMVGELIERSKAGAFVTVCKVAPSGALQARKLSSGGVMLYWRYTHEGKTERARVGPYDPRLPPKLLDPKDGGFSILAATRKAEGLAKRHLENRADGGHRALVAEERAQRAAATAAAANASQHTLRALLFAYCDHLQAIGRPSYREARSIFALHVIGAWPAMAETPAKAVSEEQLADMLRRLYELGKGRTANKLRSYLRAAYELARRARTDPSVPVTLKRFDVRLNPAAATSANSSANKADKRPLSADDLRAYWRALQRIEGPKGALLRLHLLTGGQRIAQLVKLKTADIAPGSVILIDGKGRPGKAPRSHHLPLIPDAADALADLGPVGEWAISTDGGRTHVAPTTLSTWACDVAKQIPIANFEAKRIRSGIETLLASAGVDRDSRGRLQSHGISGVQATHYDGHDYLPVKRRALEALYGLLSTAPESNVVSLKRR